MKNIFCVDLEEWFHANYNDAIDLQTRGREVRAINNTHRLLDLFEDNNVKATFFVLGSLAEEHPELIKEIFNRGHEIASHGYGHQLVYKLSKEEFREDVKKAVSIVEDIIQYKVKGYRAPSWSITKKSIWALEILQNLGIKYDSSIFPFENYLYGIVDAPRFIFETSIYDKNLTIKEIPPSTINVLNKNIPFSGGFYLRALPYLAIKSCVDMVNKEKQPVVAYIHPREIDINQPRLKLGTKEAFIHYHGIKGTEKKLSRLFSEYEFTSISDYYKDEL